MNEPLPAYSAFDGPATYRIVVNGFLSCDLSDRLEGMEISQTVKDDGAVVSILVGELMDQSALAGVLISLYELQMKLIAVEQLPAGSLPGQSKPVNPET